MNCGKKGHRPMIMTHKVTNKKGVKCAIYSEGMAILLIIFRLVGINLSKADKIHDVQ